MGVKSNGTMYDYIKWTKEQEIERSKVRKRAEHLKKKEEMKNASIEMKVAFWFKYYFILNKYYVKSFNPLFVGDKAKRIRLLKARSLNHVIIKFHKKFQCEWIADIVRVKNMKEYRELYEREKGKTVL